MLPRLARSGNDADRQVRLLRPGACGGRIVVKPEDEVERMAAQIVKMSLIQDRMVQDLAVERGSTTQWVRHNYGIGEKA